MNYALSCFSPAIRGTFALRLGALLIHLLVLPVARTSAAEGEQPKVAANFVVFDAMKARGKEDLSRYGVRPISVLYSPTMWAGSKDPATLKALPEQERIEAYIKKLPSLPGLLCTLDIEHWPLDIRKTARKDGDDIPTGDHSEVLKSVQKMRTILQWAKAARPDGRFGYYSCVPIRDYFTPVRGDATKLEEWKAANDFLQPLADDSDVLFPSLYTFYPDREGWVKYATGVIAEARRMAKGKPVYVYVWPSYHTSNKEIGGQPIEGDYWLFQLRTIRSLGADGIVLWSGSKETWNASQAWWQETIGFLREIGAHHEP